MLIVHWLSEHWFDLAQTLGIFAGFLFTAVSMRQDRESRQIHNLFSVTKQNREIWFELYQRPELSRVVEKSADLTSSPVTPAEQVFVQQLILHLSATWKAIQEREFMPLSGLQKDIASFFSLPIPAAVWKEAKRFQDHDFEVFVAHALHEAK